MIFHALLSHIAPSYKSFCTLYIFVLLKQQTKNFSHFMLPIYCYKHSPYLCADFTSLQLLNCRLDVYNSALSSFDFSFPSIYLTLSDWSFVLNVELPCRHKFITVKHCECTTVLICNSGSDSSMLNAWVSTELFLGTEYTIGSIEFGSIYLLLFKKCAIIIKAFDLFANAII